MRPLALPPSTRSGRAAARMAALTLTALSVLGAQAAAGCEDVLFYEDFSALSGWTVVDGGDPPTHGGQKAPTWTLTNPGQRQPPGLAAPFAIVDSFYNGFGLMDEELISPALDASGLTCLELVFSHDFKWYPGFRDEQAEVRVRSAATGQQWVTVKSYAGGDAGGIEIVDLAAYAAADLRVAFRYSNANWEEYWAVDDVAVLGDATTIFGDGFESGDIGAWSTTAPP